MIARTRSSVERLTSISCLCWSGLTSSRFSIVSTSHVLRPRDLHLNTPYLDRIPPRSRRRLGSARRRQTPRNSILFHGLDERHRPIDLATILFLLVGQASYQAFHGCLGVSSPPPYPLRERNDTDDVDLVGQITGSDGVAPCSEWVSLTATLLFARLDSFSVSSRRRVFPSSLWSPLNGTGVRNSLFVLLSGTGLTVL